VDDEYIARKTLKKILTSCYCEVDLDFAYNGIEAKQAYQLNLEDNQQYDLILLDLEMSDAGGRQPLESIRKFEAQHNIAEVTCLI